MFIHCSLTVHGCRVLKTAAERNPNVPDDIFDAEPALPLAPPTARGDGRFPAVPRGAGPAVAAPAPAVAAPVQPPPQTCSGCGLFDYLGLLQERDDGTGHLQPLCDACIADRDPANPGMAAANPDPDPPQPQPYDAAMVREQRLRFFGN